MLRGSYLLRLAARQPRALTALRVMSTASLAPKNSRKDLTLKIKVLDKEILALEAKRGELQRLLDEDDFPRWVRAHIDKVNRQLARQEEEPLGEFVVEGLLKGMRSAPEHTEEEVMHKTNSFPPLYCILLHKYYDPAWLYCTIEYKWDDKVVNWESASNLCYADEITLLIDGVRTTEFELEEPITAETFENTPPCSGQSSCIRSLHSFFF